MNKKTSRVILIDIDDTIENLCQEWCEYLNEQYGTAVHYTDVTDWDIAQFFPCLTREQVFEPLSREDFWYRLKPLDGAVEYIKKLMEEGFQVYLCTTTNYNNIRFKYEAIIQRYFPFISWPQIIVTSRKQLIHADFLIDDGVHNLDGGSYHKILMTAAHNRSYNAVENGMIRVNNWEEAYNSIHTIVTSEDTQIDDSTWYLFHDCWGGDI